MIKDVVPIRRDPKFVLNVLDSLAADVTFVISERGEAAGIADMVLELCEACR
jgi:hypothetical protein